MTVENPKTGRQIIWRSLTFQLLAIVVFPLIVLLLIITFGSTTLHENAMRELVSQRDERAARMASTAIEDQLQQRANQIRAIAGMISYSSPNRAGEVFTATSYLNADFDGGLAVFGIKGNVIAVQGDAAIWDEHKISVTEGLHGLAKNQKPGLYISNVLAQPSQSGPLMIVMASTENGQFVVAGAFFYPAPGGAHFRECVYTRSRGFGRCHCAWRHYSVPEGV